MTSKGIGPSGVKNEFPVRRSRVGSAAIEHGLIASLIGIAIIVGAATLGDKLSMVLSGGTETVTATPAAEPPLTE